MGLRLWLASIGQRHPWELVHRKGGRSGEREPPDNTSTGLRDKQIQVLSVRSAPKSSLDGENGHLLISYRSPRRSNTCAVAVVWLPKRVFPRQHFSLAQSALGKLEGLICPSPVPIAPHFGFLFLPSPPQLPGSPYRQVSGDGQPSWCSRSLEPSQPP